MSAESVSKDVANPGWVRPPQVYLVAILGGLGLDLLWPLRWLPAGAGVWVGVPLVIGALALFVASTGRFKAAGTPGPGNEPTSTIVRSGPYRFSRNPIYVAMMMVQIGIGFLLDDAWIIILSPASLIAVHLIAVRPEEAYLLDKFGESYRNYLASVRRYL